MQLNYCPSDGLEGLCLVDRLCGTKEQCVLLPFRAGHFAKVEGRKVVFDWYLQLHTYGAFRLSTVPNSATFLCCGVQV